MHCTNMSSMSFLGYKLRKSKTYLKEKLVREFVLDIFDILFSVHSEVQLVYGCDI